jgi:hypothetical protein
MLILLLRRFPRGLATAWRKMTEKRSCLCGSRASQARARRAAGAPCRWLSFFRCLRQDMVHKVKTPSAGSYWGTRVSWLLGSSRYRALESSIIRVKGLLRPKPQYSSSVACHFSYLISMGFSLLWGCTVQYSGDTADWSPQGTGAIPAPELKLIIVHAQSYNHTVHIRKHLRS